jgi:hypothetical protein
MGPIGFSTGALAQGDFQRGLDVQRGMERIAAVELSALRDHELPVLVEAIPALDLTGFDHVSVHAPSKLQTLDEQTVFELLLRIPEDWPIVVHPEILQTPELWRRLGRRLCIENMDMRKAIGREPNDLRELFRIYPEAGFCLDLGHARQIDPTMAMALRMYLDFGDRIRQVHVSEVNPYGKHIPIGASTRLAFAYLSKCVTIEGPLIIESVITPDLMERELDGVWAALENDGEVRWTPSYRALMTQPAH